MAVVNCKPRENTSRLNTLLVQSSVIHKKWH